MIGQKELAEALSDGFASSEGSEAGLDSAGLDPKAARSMARLLAVGLTDDLVKGPLTADLLFSVAVLQGLVIGVRAGRADAARAAQEMVERG